MSSVFNLYDIYEQNLNFLIGSVASHGFLPKKTRWLIEWTTSLELGVVVN